MPNHVRNILRFSGDKSEIKNLFSELITDDYFDFNKIIPSPDSIFRGNLGREERAIYGKNNWYDWNLENWGTKWNAYDTCLSVDDGVIEFSTAWSSPVPIAKKIKSLLKNVDIEWIYADEDTGSNTGKFNIGKNKFSHTMYEDGSNEAFATYVKTHGESQCIGHDDDGNYFHYDCDTCPNPC